MFTIETSRMVGCSDMIVENGLLKSAQQPEGILDIFSLKPSTGRESAFLFYDKENPDARICHVGITWKRGRTEVSYGTEAPYRRKGFMQEALVAFLKWFTTNTSENIIWGLPNGDESSHILKKSGFRFYGPVEEDPSCSWYVYEINRK